MTENTTTIETTAEPASTSEVDGTIPSHAPQEAVALAPAPGETTLSVVLTLNELGACAASLQACVQWGAVRDPNALNTVNSVLRKFHDAKLAWANREERK